MGSRIRTFLAELRRRKVYHVAAVYLVVGLGILGAAELILDPLGLGAARPFIVIATLLGFPLALVLAWAYEVKPEEPRVVEIPEEDTLLHPDSAPPVEFAESEPRKSIVVLPFDNMSPDPGDTYFCDGLTEEIITNLSHIRSLRVISRSSAMVLKSTQKDVRTIGRELDVQYVLEGSVRRSGDDLRITAQLIDAITDEHLWAERYDGTLDDIFEMQEQTSLAIVEALDVKINPGEREKLVERRIDDIRAYECYLRARNDIHKSTAESLKSALRHLEAGLQILGENELLHEGMAELHLQIYEVGVKADEETLQQAEEFVAKVMASRPDSASTHYLNGRIERFRGSCDRAAQHFERALEIDPNHPGALAFLVVSYALQVGRPAAADTFAKRLEAVDPLSPMAMFILAHHHWMSGRLEEALLTYDRALELEPDFVWASVFGLAYILMWQERRDEALDVLAPIARRDPRDLAADWAVLLECAIAGDSAGAAEALSVDSKSFLWNDPDVPPFIGSAYALAGAKEEALTWLERAIERGWINYPLFSTQDPLYESIRGEERFKELMVRVKARWEASRPRSVNESALPGHSPSR